MKNSSIPCTDHTFNGWIGCTKVSPGCANCYAEAQDRRWGNDSFGPGKPRRRTSEAYWRQPLLWNRESVENYDAWATHATLHGGVPLYPEPRRPRVFCGSLCDWLDDEVPSDWLFDLVALIHKTPNLDWQLLTKRPEKFASRMMAAAGQCTIDPIDITDRIYAWVDGARIYRNVWIGTTVEDQQRADERIPALLKIPARVRFLSCEPLLGEINIREHLLTPILGCAHKNPDDGCCNNPAAMTPECHLDACLLPQKRQMLHWVICGGESGPHARPMHPDWARSLLDQCASSGVPFFFKQWGEWAICRPDLKAKQIVIMWSDGRIMNEDEWLKFCADNGPQGGRSLSWSAHALGRYGKAASGCLLDGVEHKDFPK